MERSAYTRSWDKTGKDPMTVRWVDTNKGGEKVGFENPGVVKQVDEHWDELFAETPPLEAKRILINRAMARR